MTELPPSQLPEDPGYWERMARRISADAQIPLARYAAAEESWLQVLDRCAAWLLPLAATCMLLFWISLPRHPMSLATDWTERWLTPSEVPSKLLRDDRPPSVEAVLVQFSPEQERGGHR